MSVNQDINRWNHTLALLPDAGKILQAQTAAKQNATRTALQSCRFLLSMKRVMLDLWSGRLDVALGRYGEAEQETSSVAVKAQQEAQGAVKEAGAAIEGAANDWHKVERTA
jgi:hypothetical protein